MAERYYRGSGKRKKRRGGWLPIFFCVLAALLLRYGQSEPLIRLRQKAANWMAESKVCEQAVMQVGKLFSGNGEDGVLDVFGQLFFGETEE